jgi:hypothetical protein
METEAMVSDSAADPIETACLMFMVDGPGNCMSLLVPEVRTELAPDKPSPSEILTALRHLFVRGLITVEHERGDVERTPDSEALWSQMAREYESGERDPDLVQQNLAMHDLWFRPTDEGRHHAVAIGAAIEHPAPQA